MNPKITILIGTGASLDFVSELNAELDESIDISTWGLTKLILKDSSSISAEHPEILPFIAKCKSFLDKRYNRYANFEEIYQLILCLLSTTDSSTPVLDYDTSQFDGRPDAEICRLSLGHIIMSICSELHKLRNQVHKEWAKTFIEDIAGNRFVDMFTLNYDDLLDDILDDPSDGFTKETTEKIGNVGEYYAFDAKSATIKDDCNLLNHLHGSIHFLTAAPEGEMVDSPMYKYVVPAPNFIDFSIIELQNRTLSLYSSIISGQDKMNAQLHFPYSVYYANFVRSMCTNDYLIIIGYGFGDYYINAQIYGFLGMGKRAIFISPSPPPSIIEMERSSGNIHHSKKYDFWWIATTFRDAATSYSDMITNLIPENN